MRLLRRGAAAGEPTRVLVTSHGHPRLAKGGAEIAAYALYEALQRRADTTAWFLGCGRDVNAAHFGSSISQPFTDREFIYTSNEFDWFKFANRDLGFPRRMEELLQELQPAVIHFHHFANFGVEVFQLVRRVLPNVRIVLTLHDYLAICNHFGQMVTTDRYSLCYEASDTRCSRCFPNLSATDFFLRRSYISRFFDEVDQFVSPSQFLAERFVKWGLPSAKNSGNRQRDLANATIKACRAAGPELAAHWVFRSDLLVERLQRADQRCGAA